MILADAMPSLDRGSIWKSFVDRGDSPSNEPAPFSATFDAEDPLQEPPLEEVRGSEGPANSHSLDSLRDELRRELHALVDQLRAELARADSAQLVAMQL